MRWLAGMLLLTFGCSQLRYASRTEMAETPSDPAIVAPTLEPPQPRRFLRRRQAVGMIVGGSVMLVVGLGLLLGGTLGMEKNDAANVASDQQCMATGGWFCGAFDGLSDLPYYALISWGAVLGLSGLTLIFIGGDRFPGK
jgi:hypothetical protein